MTLLFVSLIKPSLVLLAAFGVLALLQYKSAALRHMVLASALFSAAVVPPLTFVVPAHNLSIAPIDRQWFQRWFQIQLPGKAAELTPVAPVHQSMATERPSTPSKAKNFAPPASPRPAESQVGHTAPPRRDANAARSPIVKVVPARNVTPEMIVAKANDAWREIRANAGMVLAVTWLIGIGLAFAGLGLGLTQLVWIAHTSVPIVDGVWEKVAKEVSAHYHLRHPVRILLSRETSVLATWGILRPVLILPKGAGEWPEERIRVVICHEFAHIHRGDWLVQIVAEMERAVYWFNPLFWMACSRLVQESEQACDDAALRLGIRESDYAAELLALTRDLNVRFRTVPVAASMARPSTLERRFKALLNPRADRRRTSRFSTSTTAAAFLMVTVLLVAFRLVQSAAIPITLAAASAPRTAATFLPEAPPQTPIIENGSGSTSIDGIVVRWGTREPISGAEVELTRVEGTSEAPLQQTPARAQTVFDPSGIPATTRPEILPHIVTDQTGTFRFSELKPGSYTLVVQEKTGAYNPAEFGQRNPRGPGLRITLDKGQTMRAVRLEMAPTGSISGRIVDENGEPMGHVSVQALERESRDGARLLNTVESVDTDERGEYRLFWLPPGHYYIAARVMDLQRRSVPLLVKLPGTAGSNNRSGTPVTKTRILPGGEVIEEIYQIVYNGSVIDPARTRALDLHAGAELAGVDISMAPGKTRARHVRGVVINGLTGQPVPSIAVRTEQMESTGNRFIVSVSSDSSGRFDCAVAPGTLNILAIANGTAADQSGSTDIVVGDADVNDVKVITWPTGSSVSGRVSIEGRIATDNDPDLAKLRIQMIWGQERGFYMNGEGSTFPVKPDGTIRFQIGQQRGHFGVKVAGVPAGMYVKSIRAGQTDVIANGLSSDTNIDEKGNLRDPIEIVIGTNGATVEGKVIDNHDSPMAATMVVLVPESQALRSRQELYRTAVSDAKGKFHLSVVPPGDYKLFAFEYAEADAWQDPDFLQPYEARGKSVHVIGNTLQPLTVTAIAVP